MTASRVRKVRNKRLMPIRWRELDGRILLTNDCGDHVRLERREFDALMAGTLAKDRPVWRELSSRNMIRGAEVEGRAADRIRARSSHLFAGPGLHIVILTLRCNHNCVYCHASRQPASRAGFDMNVETAGRVLDVVFESPSTDLTIEFQGGEPTLNFDRSEEHTSELQSQYS